MKKNMFVVMIALFTAVIFSGVASAVVPVEVLDVTVNGVHLDELQNDLDVNRGEEMEVEVLIKSDGELDDARFSVVISGYEYGKYESALIEDVKYVDIPANKTRMYTFNLEAPVKISTEAYDLRVNIEGKKGAGVEVLYPITFGSLEDEDAIVIKDFTVSPSAVVEAGRPLSFKVRVHNYGNDEMNDVSVRIAIPELGIADNEYLDEIDADEAETFEELLLRVPQCAAPGRYEAVATIEFKEYEETSQSMTITVLQSGACEVVTDDEKPRAKTVVTVPESQEVMMGTTGGVYPVMISNLGSSAKTYTLTASGADAWGTVRFDPAAVVVVQPESVKTVYMYVSAKEDAQAGSQVFKLTIDSADESKQVVLTANVKESVEGADALSKDNLTKGLTYALIVLVIILIILGLIIGFNKLRGDKNDDDDESQTYY